MLKKISAISKVGHSFESIRGFIALISVDGFLVLREIKNNREYLILDEIFTGLGIFSETEIYLNQGFVSKILSTDTLLTTDVPCKIEAVTSKRVICSEKENRNRYLISKLREGNSEWKKLLKRGKCLYLNESFLINTKYLDDSIILSYNLEDGGEIWSYDVTNLGTWQDYDSSEKIIQVSRILGIYEDHVYLYLNSGKVLILNVETGEKISVLENDKNTDQGSFSGMFMNAIELDESKGKLIQLFNQRYTEVDLNTKVVTQIHLEDMKSLNLENMSRFVYDDDHIFFTDKNHQKLGALNRSTLKIDWTYELSQEEISKSEQPRYGRDLKLRGNRLYVLDNKFTLHIFEKE